jgi:hypothetical protein
VGALYRKNLRTGKVRRVDVSSTGAAGNGDTYGGALSADGRLVAFSSDSSNLVRRDANPSADVFVRNLRTGRTALVSVTSREEARVGVASIVRITPNGRLVAFTSNADLAPADIDVGTMDVFVRDRRRGTTRLVSRVPPVGPDDGSSYWNVLGALSDSGRYVVYSAIRANDGDPTCSTVYLHDRRAHTQTRIAPPCSVDDPIGERHYTWSEAAAISQHGRWVLLTTTAPISPEEQGETDTDVGNATDPDVFLLDRRTGRTLRVSDPVPSGDGPGAAFAPSVGGDMTPDASVAVFSSLVAFLPTHPPGSAAAYLRGLTRTFSGPAQPPSRR